MSRCLSNNFDMLLMYIIIKCHQNKLSKNINSHPLLTSPLFYCMIGTVVPKRLFVLHRNRRSLSSGFRKNDMMLVTQTGIRSPTPYSYGKLSLSYTFIMFGFQTSLISLSLWWEIHILQEICITTQRHQSKNGG